LGAVDLAVGGESGVQVELEGAGAELRVATGATEAGAQRGVCLGARQALAAEPFNGSVEQAPHEAVASILGVRRLSAIVRSERAAKWPVQ
jgi:hypothetical protein